MATSKKFSELTAASTFTANDLAAVAHVDAQAETGYESQKATMMQLGQYLNKDMQYATDLSKFPSGKQSPIPAINDLRDFLYAQLPVNQASGSIANFTTSLALPLVDGKFELPYDANGYTGMNIVNESDNDLAPFLKGVYEGKNGFVDLGTLEFIYNSTYGVFQANLSTAPNNTGIGNMPNIICPKYTTITARGLSGSTGWVSYTGDKAISLGYDTARVIIKDTAYTDAQTFKTAMSGVYLVYELATPTSPSITPTQLATILNSFNASGTVYPITFGQTIYGGEFDSVTGKLTSKYNADGTEKTTPDIIDLSPVSIIPLIGTNNILVDTNGNTEISYKLTSQEYTDLKIAELQAIVLQT